MPKYIEVTAIGAGGVKSPVSALQHQKKRKRVTWHLGELLIRMEAEDAEKIIAYLQMQFDRGNGYQKTLRYMLECALQS